VGDALFVHGGVTDAQEARLALGGLIAALGPAALDVRTGVMNGPGATALVTGTSSTGPMTVSIGPHYWVTSRGSSNGPYLGVLAAAQAVSIGAAPGSGTRVDVVWVKQQDNTPGVPTPDVVAPSPLYGVTPGTPTKQPIPVGAEELATVAVSAGATRTTDGTVVITQTARITAARGGIVLVKTQAERVALTGWPGLQVIELDNGRLLWHDGTRFRYHGDQVTVSTTGQRDALTAYEGLHAVVTGAGKYLYTAGAWVPYNQWTDLLRSTSYNYTPPTGSAYVDLTSGNFTINGLPPGREIEFEWKAPLIAAGTNATLALRMLIAGTQVDTSVFSTSTAPMFGPGRLTGSAVIPSGGSVLVQVQGFNGVGATATPIQAGTSFAAAGAVVLRYRVR
jgi:hypothetical protein